MDMYHTDKDGNTRSLILPHGGGCWYPLCNQRRLDRALFCAQHELFWRANYEIPSEFSSSDERTQFFDPYWQTARLGAVAVLDVANAPEETKIRVVEAIARAAVRCSEGQQSGDGFDIPVPQVEVKP